MAVDPGFLPTLSINLGHADTPHDLCQVWAFEEFERLTAPSMTVPGYGEYEVNASVLVIPDDIETDWWATPPSKWMRYKVRRAVQLGYEFAPFTLNDCLDDVYAINTSMRERQGRPMDEQYRQPPIPEISVDLPCRRHRFDWLGVFRNSRLYAYIHALQVGEMMNLSRIIGHGDHLDDGIMNLLVYEAVKRNQALSGARYAVYYLQDSGTEGLQFFKRKMGFTGYLVRFELGSP